MGPTASPSPSTALFTVPYNNGSSVCVVGSQCQAEWTHTGFIDTVSLYLLASDGTQATLAANIPNTGTFTWPVAAEVVAGAGLQLHLLSVNPLVEAFSSDFT